MAEKMDKKIQVYNAVGSNEMDEAKNETPGFKKGGRKKKALGGMSASGEMAEKRLDRRPRRAAGGATKGHNPYSSAAALQGPTNDASAKGYEGTGGKRD